MGPRWECPNCHARMSLWGKGQHLLAEFRRLHASGHWLFPLEAK